MQQKIYLTLAVLFVILITSCAPGTVAPLLTPSQTSVPKPTVTQIPMIQVGGIQIPDPRSSNPALFDLNNADSPIVQFAKAFEIKPAVVQLQNPQLLTSRDGKQFIVLTTSDIPDTKDLDETGIPLFIGVKNGDGEWVWSSSSLKEMCSLNGLKCGSTVSGDENHEDPRYDALIQHEFSIISPGGTPPECVESGDLQFEHDYLSLAQKYGMSFRPAHMFGGADEYPPNLSMQADALKWMNSFTEKVITGYPQFDSVVFANEPVGIYDGSQYWVNFGNWYKAFGEQWPIEAYSMIYNQLGALGLKPGKNVHLILNLPYGSKEWGYDPQFTIDFMALMKKQIQAKVGPDAIMDVGIQFHLRDVPQDHETWGGPNIADLDEEKLTQFFQDLGEIGPVHITELSTKNVEDRGTAMDGINLVFSAAIRSGVVKDILFWEALKTDDFLFDDQFQNDPGYYLLLQTLLVNLP